MTHPAGSLPSPAGAGRLWLATSDDASFSGRLSLDRRLTLDGGLASPFGASAEAPDMTTRVRGPAYPMCVHWDWRGDAAPPFEPPAPRAAAGQRADRGRRPPNPRTGALMPERRSGEIHLRVSPAERAAWRAKAAEAGVPLSALLRQAMARTRTWTAPALAAERERTPDRAHRQQPEPARALGEHPRLRGRGRHGDRPPRGVRAVVARPGPSRRRGRRCTLGASVTARARPVRRPTVSSANATPRGGCVRVSKSCVGTPTTWPSSPTRWSSSASTPRS